MSRLRERFPPRLADPLARVRGHVDRRAGAVDDARERRVRRKDERGPFVGGDTAAARTVTVRTNTGNVGAAAQNTVTSACDAGEVCTGGGGTCTGAGANLTMIGSSPNPSTDGGEPTGWDATFRNDTGASQTITAYAVCLSQ